MMRRRQTGTPGHRDATRGRVIGGVAIMAGMIAIVFAVTSLTTILQAIRGTYEVHAVFDQATGLRIGAPVWIAGHEAGQVRAIGFRPVGPDSTPGIVVTIRLPEDMRTFVRRDSRVRLSSARLVGDPVVDIAPGSASAPVLPAGETLYAQPITTHATVMQHAALFTESIDSLMSGIAGLKPAVDRNARRFQLLGARLSAASTELGTFRATLAGAQSFNADTIIGRIQSLGATMHDIETEFAAAGQLAEDNGTRSALENAGRRAARVAQQTDSLSRLLARGTIARLQTDSALHFALRRTQAQLDSLIVETKRNPLRFWLGNQGKRPEY